LWLNVTHHLSESPRRFRPLLVYFMGSPNLTFSAFHRAKRPSYILDYVSDYKLAAFGSETLLTAVIVAEKPESRGKKPQVAGAVSSHSEHTECLLTSTFSVCKPEVRGSIPLCSTKFSQVSGIVAGLFPFKTDIQPTFTDQTWRQCFRCGDSIGLFS